MAQKLSNLANKSKVKFGSLYGSPIVWIVADKNHAGYPSNSVTLVTNQIIKMLCIDATEPSNGNSDRRGYGNHRYIYSNLRQWLNSPAAAGQWYTAQHSADQTPDSSHVWNGGNPYSGLAGFLNAFTANERAALLNTTITVGKSSTDGGGTETCTDKIFPLSCTEVGLSGDHVCGSKLAIFSDNNSRIATVTASCVANSNYSSNPGSGAAWYYWLRDAYAGSARFARYVGTDGPLDWNGAYDGYYGLRPACNLSSDLLISDSVDSDGCYTVIYNQAPTAPSSITVPSEVLGGENLSISWAASTDPDGNLSGYVLERKVGSGTWAQVYKGSARTYTDTITYGWTSVQYRVKASPGRESGRSGCGQTCHRNSSPTSSRSSGWTSRRRSSAGSRTAAESSLTTSWTIWRPLSAPPSTTCSGKNEKTARQRRRAAFFVEKRGKMLKICRIMLDIIEQMLYNIITGKG